MTRARALQPPNVPPSAWMTLLLFDGCASANVLYCHLLPVLHCCMVACSCNSCQIICTSQCAACRKMTKSTTRSTTTTTTTATQHARTSITTTNTCATPHAHTRETTIHTWTTSTTAGEPHRCKPHVQIVQLSGAGSLLNNLSYQLAQTRQQVSLIAVPAECCGCWMLDPFLLDSDVSYHIHAPAGVHSVLRESSSYGVVALHTHKAASCTASQAHCFPTL
jgi:hypothetical protein